MRSISFLLSLGVLLFCGCGVNKPDSASVHHVMVVNPVATNSSLTKHLSGQLREAGMVSVAFKTPGQLIEINVKEGDYVRSGQLLARLDDADYQLGVEAYQIQYDQLSEEVSRLRRLAEAKSISGNDLEKAEAGLMQLGVQLQANKNKVSYTRLYAPTDGYIQKVNFEVAEMVDAGTPVFSLINTKHLEVELNIPGSILDLQERFGAIEGVVSASHESISLPLKVLSVTPKADANQLYTMRLIVTSAVPKGVHAGMNAEVNIRIDPVDEAPDLFLVPLHAVCERDGDSFVWVVNADGSVARRKVAVEGIDGQGYAIISGGVSGDDKVVKAGLEVLSEGETVTVIGQTSATNVGGLL